MAQHYVHSSPVKVGISKAHVTAGSTPVSTTDLATPANYQSPGSLDTRLLAIGGIYTQVYLDSLTLNDKVYALKLNDDNTNYGML